MRSYRCYKSHWNAYIFSFYCRTQFWINIIKMQHINNELIMSKLSWAAHFARCFPIRFAHFFSFCFVPCINQPSIYALRNKKRYEQISHICLYTSNHLLLFFGKIDIVDVYNTIKSGASQRDVASTYSLVSSTEKHYDFLWVLTIYRFSAPVSVVGKFLLDRQPFLKTIESIESSKNNVLFLCTSYFYLHSEKCLYYAQKAL